MILNYNTTKLLKKLDTTKLLKKLDKIIYPNHGRIYWDIFKSETQKELVQLKIHFEALYV